ncbi:MAG: BTAD domain-containing putative transcriptional regulator [Anaerolineae bacterium]|nr:BTAD domain-containing putative transcriptional regulator [Anaerolineae bacterium]
MLEVRLFGTGQVSYGSRSLPGFPNQQCHFLLCYLLLNRRRPHQREQLAAVFWNEYPANVSRKYLRNAIWRLRGALESVGVQPDQYLALDDGSVCFAPKGEYWLDVQAFEATVTRYQNVASYELSAEQAAALAEAVDLCCGDLLEGVYEDWCLYDRERLRLLHLDALGRLVAFCGTHGAYERGLAYGERILARDNTREKVHRQMMQLYWLSGQRDRALAQYERCSEALRETLGIAPLPETQRLYEQMARGHCDPTRWPAFRRRVPEPVPPGASASEQAALHIRNLQGLLSAARVELQEIERLLAAAQAHAARPTAPPDQAPDR